MIQAQLRDRRLPVRATQHRPGVRLGERLCGPRSTGGKSRDKLIEALPRTLFGAAFAEAGRRRRRALPRKHGWRAAR